MLYALKILFSLLKSMVEQCRGLNITYAPIMENYSRFNKIPRVPRDQLEYEKISETMETGDYKRIDIKIAIGNF